MQDKPYINFFDNKRLFFKNSSIKKTLKKIDITEVVVGESYFIELEYKDNFVKVVLKKIETENSVYDKNNKGNIISKLIWELPDKTIYVEKTFWYTDSPEIFSMKFKVLGEDNSYHLIFKANKFKELFLINGLDGSLQKI